MPLLCHQPEKGSRIPRVFLGRASVPANPNISKIMGLAETLAFPNPSFSLGGIGQAAQEQQAAGTGVADAEDERMVGAENGRRRRRPHGHGVERRYYNRRRGRKSVVSGAGPVARQRG